MFREFCETPYKHREHAVASVPGLSTKVRRLYPRPNIVAASCIKNGEKMLESWLGYHIPGDSTVILSSWSVLYLQSLFNSFALHAIHNRATLHDERTYSYPDESFPERFLVTPSGETDLSTAWHVAAFGLDIVLVLV